MGNASSQPEGAANGVENSQTSVPETPTTTKTQGKKSPDLPNAASPSQAIPELNGPVTVSGASKPAKRKRESEPQRQKKSKKKPKSDKHVEEETDEANVDTPVAAETPIAKPTEVAPTPSQPSPSKSPRPEAVQARKQKKHAKTPTTPSVKSTPKTPRAGPNSVPATPIPEGSLTPGGRPKSIRGSRTRAKDSLKIGFYTPQEVEKIENFKINFCTMHGISGSVFDEMIQHSDRGSGDFPVSENVVKKADFWNDIYGLVPDRDRRSVYRFMRRHFQASTQKAHDWSEEQDDELIDLYTKHGPKWTFIGRLLGRSDDDVTQRWKNKLEHKGTMNQGAWDEEEFNVFLEAMEACWASMKPLLGGKAGKDLYDLDEQTIIWGNISKAMGHKRSRQQCADKWRKIVKHVKNLRANGMPDAVFDYASSSKKAAAWKARSSAIKSAEFVEDESNDEGDDEVNEDPKSNGGPEIANSQPEPEPQPEPRLEPEADNLPEPQATPKEPKKSKSKKSNKRKSSDAAATELPPPQLENGAQSDDDEPELPPPSKQTKAERKREQKALREKEQQARIIAEAVVEARPREASPEEPKRPKKAKKQRPQEDIFDAPSQSPEPPRKRARKALKKAEIANEPRGESPQPIEEPPRSESPPSQSPPNKVLAAEASDDDKSSESEGDSDMDIKHEYDSEEL
ncbi:Homeodomain-like [Penicillium brevicompactum]|uniref:uncharacterized protein n=1 Tax=Penicillium brevicompactum TaxID=5074 RepID=UPI00254182D0|nr:uncharacterized protein N7506_009942 [Penicillium brevicompactum]KAJ5326840.1 hypothetical protein N7506_009942 [Penicillium brevicompactum]